jgi:predicted DCC family thiol-disulfide oxidoreductase YuxK
LEPSASLQHVFSECSSSIVLFDGSCNFCSASTWFMLGNSNANSLRFAAQQSDIGLKLLKAFELEPETLSSIAVLQQNGRLLTRSDAVLEIASRMHEPYPLAAQVRA